MPVNIHGRDGLKRDDNADVYGDLTVEITDPQLDQPITIKASVKQVASTDEATKAALLRARIALERLIGQVTAELSRLG